MREVAALMLKLGTIAFGALKDALRLESILTAAGVDYGVEADNYRGGVVFQTERVGAFFYVRPETVAVAQQIMREHGYRPRDPEPPKPA